MNPEQWLLIIHKDLAVKLLVLLLGALVGMFGPEGLRVTQRYRTLVDLHLILCR